nr:CGNR zinc finger domain-containing protein [Nocardia grenadensis]
MARDAIDLFTGAHAGRIRTCSAADCQLLHVDTSRPGRRRRCSMEHCGNRNKVRAHRARTPRKKGDHYAHRAHRGRGPADRRLSYAAPARPAAGPAYVSRRSNPIGVIAGISPDAMTARASGRSAQSSSARSPGGQHRVRRRGRRVGARLDRGLHRPALLGNAAVAGESFAAQRVEPVRPFRAVEISGHGVGLARHPVRQGLQHMRFAPVDSGGDHRGDMPVAPMLPQQGRRVPQPRHRVTRFG